MRPTVNRAVHYHTVDTPDPQAAIITRVAPVDSDNDRVLEDVRTEENDWKVHLAIFFHTEKTQDIDFTVHPVPFSPTPKPGCWTWPPRA